MTPKDPFYGAVKHGGEVRAEATARVRIKLAYWYQKIVISV